MQWTLPELSLPPREARNYDDDDYLMSAVWNLKKLSTLVELRPNMRILEIGCAAGRLAVPLLEFLDPDAGGSYDGIDVNMTCIAWAHTHISPKWPHFRFRHVDVQHQVSNPAGRLNASEVDLGLDRRRYDLVMMHSVYSHLLPATIESYTRQISQALVPDGAVYLTLFEWDEEAEDCCSAGTCPRSFDHELGGVRVEDPDLPTAAVAVDAEFLGETMESNKLRRQSLVRGNWRTESPNGQDIAIYRSMEGND